ncbi:MAG: CpsD/CapB family tyrosine-protein kinase [Erysipelotrichaceae bacterium]|nr:CpsD/CapB family tyrosine-protein kinase [Erysipelotrichaceae bacterium]
MMKHLYLDKMPELPFQIAEAMNQLRINLGFSGENVRTIMITSSTPNEGKSFVAVQLWKMLAEVGNRTLLIDCDLRNSEMRNKYGLRAEDGMIGIEHFLAGKSDIEDVIFETDIENGYMIPVVTNIANPTILLECKKFSDMINVTKQNFDYVLIDTPPLGSVADALTVAGYCDGSLLVVRSGDTPRKLIENSVQLLQRTETPMLGMVLNRADTGRKGNGYYYNHYYRYGYNDYGYGRSKK